MEMQTRLVYADGAMHLATPSPAAIFARLNESRKPSTANTNKTHRKQGPLPREKFSFFTEVTERFSGYFDLTSTVHEALS